MSQLLGPPIPEGNKITRLENGSEIFPAMLAGIARVKTTIRFGTYPYWSGETAEQFLIALSKKARNVEKVPVLRPFAKNNFRNPHKRLLRPLESFNARELLDFISSQIPILASSMTLKSP